MNAAGHQGGIFQMLSHGIVSGALFLCVGVVYDRMHTREIAAYGGLVNRMPLYALASWSSPWPMSGLPGTSGFVGEFLTLVGAFQVNTWVAFFATTGVILSAAYALWLYRDESADTVVGWLVSGCWSSPPSGLFRRDRHPYRLRRRLHRRRLRR
jgi:NADH-quinone oxidoreductase subunit M